VGGLCEPTSVRYKYKITDAGLVMAASNIWLRKALALRGLCDNVGELAPSVNYDDVR